MSSNHIVKNFIGLLICSIFFSFVSIVYFLILDIFLFCVFFFIFFYILFFQFLYLIFLTNSILFQYIYDIKSL